MTATAGYERELEWDEPPSPGERRYARWTVVRARGTPAAGWWPLCQIADVALYLAPPGHERDAATLSVEPVVACKRGRRSAGDYVGVDGQVRLAVGWEEDPVSPPVAVVPPPRPFPPPVTPSLAKSPGADARAARSVRVAVLDVSFDNLDVLSGLGAGATRVDGPFPVGLPGVDGEARDAAAGRAPLSRAPGHGTTMAGILLAEVPDVHLGLFSIPGVAGAARPYLAATDLAAAIAAAVEAWRADVVLIAMSDGAWGTPRHLRDVLRAAARFGRGGRGAAIFCSVGDPSRNHVRREDSAALGADDLASQPWVEAVAACDRRGRWYRVYPRYGAGNGATYNRLGPAVALSATGEPRRYGERVAADDSSQATALAASAAARVLRDNPELTAIELRALLALTADVPPIVDGGRGLAAGRFDARDRQGHSLKLGYGVVNARAAGLAAADPICLALLATREVPDADVDVDVDAGIDVAPGAGIGPQRALAMAEAWRAAVRAAAADGDEGAGELASGYLRVAGRLSRLYLHALPVQGALGWLARHLRALAESTDCATRVWSGSQDHGALVERIRHAAETVREAVDATDDEAGAWARRLEEALAEEGAGGAVCRLVSQLFCRDVGGDVARNVCRKVCRTLAISVAPVNRGAVRLPDDEGYGRQP